MAWNDFLQQGKGLYQQGKNWLTGNNLTSQNPNTVRAMNLDALGTNNQLQNESFSDLNYQDMEGVHGPLGHSGLQSVMPHNVGNWRDEMNPQNVDWSLPYQPDRPFPHTGMQAPGFMEEPSGVGEGYDKRGFNFPNFGVLGLLNKMKDQFQYKGATEELWDPRTGEMISAEEQDKQNALGGYYSPAAKHARLQDKRVMRMLALKDAKKGYSETNLKKLQGLGYGPEEIIKETIKGTGTVPGHGGEGNQMAMSQMADRGRARAPGETGQIAGAHHFNQGGRAGYAFGKGPVLDENVDENIFEFMQDQGVPHSEMAEKSPFEMRIDELMDTGMSWQEAYDIASDEFNQLAEGGEESFSEEGIASLV